MSVTRDYHFVRHLADKQRPLTPIYQYPSEPWLQRRGKLLFGALLASGLIVLLFAEFSYAGKKKEKEISTSSYF